MMNDSRKRRMEPYSPSFDKKVKEARSSKAKGELITVNLENVWGSIEPGFEQPGMEMSIKAVWFQADRILIRQAQGKSEMLLRLLYVHIDTTIYIWTLEADESTN